MLNFLPACYFFPMTSFPVLAHVKSFLPKMDAANSELREKMREKGEESVQIENVDESDPHITMVSARLCSCAHMPHGT